MLQGEASILTRRGLGIAAASLAASRWSDATPALLPPLPRIGLGTCCDEPEDARQQILAGLAEGYRLVDTSAHYPSEEAVGGALDDAVARGICARSDVTVCTKIWFDDLGYEPALASAIRSSAPARLASRPPPA